MLKFEKKIHRQKVNNFLMRIISSNKDAVHRVLLLVFHSIGKYNAGLHNGLSPCAAWPVGTRRLDGCSGICGAMDLGINMRIILKWVEIERVFEKLV